MLKSSARRDDKSRCRLLPARHRRLPAAYRFGLAGGMAATLTPTPQVAVADESQSALLRTGKQLFDTSCVTRHGANLQGEQGRGPSLVGGRRGGVLPGFHRSHAGHARRGSGRPQGTDLRRPPDRCPRRLRPVHRRRPDGSARRQRSGGRSLSARERRRSWWRPFRLNCSSCHNFTGKGGALSSGKYAPDLSPATPAQIYTAMLDRTAEHAKFSDRQLSPEEKRHRRLRSHGGNGADPGGYGPAASDPRPRGMAAWIIGMVACIGWRCGSERGHERRHKPADGRTAASMSQDELRELEASSTASKPSSREPRWPVEGTKAEKRAERVGSYWLLLGGLSGLALLLIFIFWPWKYLPGTAEGHWWYDLSTPLYGLTFGLSILAIGVGAVLYQKKFIPEEISIQDRHDGRSSELDRKTVVANLGDALDGSTIKRRKMVGLSLGISLGAFGAGTLVAFIGGLIKNQEAGGSTAEGKKAVLWTSGGPRYAGETIFPGRATGLPGESPFVKMRPRISTPAAWRRCSWRESDGDGTTIESHEHPAPSRWVFATR